VLHGLAPKILGLHMGFPSNTVGLCCFCCF
jgi:hypothetical protein